MMLLKLCEQGKSLVSVLDTLEQETLCWLCRQNIGCVTVQAGWYEFFMIEGSREYFFVLNQQEK